MAHALNRTAKPLATSQLRNHRKPTIGTPDMCVRVAKMRGPLLLAHAFMLWGGLSSCSLALDTGGVQCSTTADCPRAAAGSSLVCLEGVCVSAAQGALCDAYIDANVSDPAVVLNVITDSASRDPVQGVTQSLCRSNDPECLAPIDSNVSDRTGTVRVSFPLQQARDIFARLSPPADYYPDRRVSNRIETFAGEVVENASINRRSVANTLILKATGQPADPSKAQLIIAFYDCPGAGPPVLTSGIQAEFERLDGAPSSNRLLYAVDGIPSESADRSFDGWAWLLNEAPGTIRLRAKDATTKAPFANPVDITLVANEAATVLIVAERSPMP
jgi:hypothetical protein